MDDSGMELEWLVVVVEWLVVVETFERVEKHQMTFDWTTEHWSSEGSPRGNIATRPNESTTRANNRSITHCQFINDMI